MAHRSAREVPRGSEAICICEGANGPFAHRRRWGICTCVRMGRLHFVARVPNGLRAPGVSSLAGPWLTCYRPPLELSRPRAIEGTQLFSGMFSLSMFLRMGSHWLRMLHAVPSVVAEFCPIVSTDAPGSRAVLFSSEIRCYLRANRLSSENAMAKQVSEASDFDHAVGKDSDDEGDEETLQLRYPLSLGNGDGPMAMATDEFFEARIRNRRSKRCDAALHRISVLASGSPTDSSIARPRHWAIRPLRFESPEHPRGRQPGLVPVVVRFGRAPRHLQWGPLRFEPPPSPLPS